MFIVGVICFAIAGILTLFLAYLTITISPSGGQRKCDIAEITGCVDSILLLL